MEIPPTKVQAKHDFAPAPRLFGEPRMEIRAEREASPRRRACHRPNPVQRRPARAIEIRLLGLGMEPGPRLASELRVPVSQLASTNLVAVMEKLMEMWTSPPWPPPAYTPPWTWLAPQHG